MRRGITVLVVVVVAAIALAAGIDTLLGGDDPQSAAQTEPEPPSVSTAAEPATSASELTGKLYYTDGSCELQAIELPGQTPVQAPGWDECRFVLSPSEQPVSPAGSGWDTYSDPRIGRLFQSEDGTIQVATNLGPDGEPFKGEAPPGARTER